MIYSTAIVERLVAIHRSLSQGQVPHAFGGAIALGYWTLDPRGTSDIDVNLFIPVDERQRALQALPNEIAQPRKATDAIARDGQARLWWKETPIDLFFQNVPIHAQAERHRQVVPFADVHIPILGPIELAVFKALFDRTKDWADIEAMIAAGTLDVDAVRAELETMLGDDDPRLSRLTEAVRLAARLRGGAGPGG